MSCNGKQSSDFPEAEKRHSLESEVYSEIYKELTNLTSQVQMMSDSLVACKQMSKYRSLRKTYSLKGHTQIDVAEPEPSIEVLHSPQQEKPKRNSNEEHAVVVSYVLGQRPELTDGYGKFGEGAEGRRGRREGSLAEESTRSWDEASGAVMTQREANTVRVIGFVQDELNRLKDLAPTLGTLVTALRDSIAHHKECDRCRVKIIPALPSIRNRIQKIVKYVTERKQRKVRDDEHSDLEGDEPQVRRKVSATVEKIELVAVDGGVPGVQLLLEVKPKKARKRFFAKACPSPSAWTSSRSFAVVQLREPESFPVVQVLQRKSKLDIPFKEKRGVVEVKDFAYSCRLVPGYRTGFLSSFRIASPVTKLVRTRTARPEVSSRSSGSSSGKRVRKKSNDQSSRESQQKLGHPKRSNESGKPRKGSNLAKVSRIVRELLSEVEQGKMHDPRVQNLEAGVKRLQSIMTEVHKNQVALSKYLIEKNIHSQAIFRLTDPSVLEKENEMVRQIAEIQTFRNRTFSYGALQMAVNDLINKCSLKNRIIMIILKGLESDTPKECWEDMVEYAFCESKPIDDFYFEEVPEIVERTEDLSASEEKKSKPQILVPRGEDVPSDEELKIKGSEGEDFEEELKTVSNTSEVTAEAKDAESATKFEDFPADFLAFPLTSQPDIVSDSIRKLENQLSLLNSENEKLWHEVHDLKNLLMHSIKDFEEKRMSSIELDKQPASSQALAKTQGKTINLIIQIVDKDFQVSKDPGLPVKFSKILVPDNEAPKSPAVRYSSSESFSGRLKKRRESEHDLGVVSLEPEFSIGAKSDRRRSESDLNYLDEPSAGVFDRELEEEGLRTVFGETFLGQGPVRQMHQIMMAKSSGRRLKPVMWVPSEYKIPEVSDGHQAGPSRGRPEIGYLIQKPSLMKLTEKRVPDMVAMMANERELQTIPENDCSPSTSSRSLSQEIQRLRARVRLIHKNVIVLKSKNDRIDKLLDRLMNDAVESGQSFRDIRQDFDRLMDQLG